MDRWQFEQSKCAFTSTTSRVPQLDVLYKSVNMRCFLVELRVEKQIIWSVRQTSEST